MQSRREQPDVRVSPQALSWVLPNYSKQPCLRHMASRALKSPQTGRYKLQKSTGFPVSKLPSHGDAPLHGNPRGEKQAGRRRTLNKH